jgi:prephenate dehydrogenase
MEKMNLSNLNITIIGLGLIGGSIAKSIRKNMDIKNLWAVDINENILNKSKSEGIIDHGFTNAKFPLQNSDLIIICTYFNTTIKFIKENMEYFKENSIITDVSGLKSKLVHEMNLNLKENVEFISGHPMAGKEKKGYDYSDDKIFIGANYILTPSINTSESSLNLLKDIIKNMGVKNITVISPKEHDEIIAFTSQLPHIIACSLMNSKKADKKSLKCTGGAFKDMTRVAENNADMWCEIINENKENIISELDNFISDLNNMKKLIENNNTENLKLEFIKSKERKKSWNNEISAKENI